MKMSEFLATHLAGETDRELSEELARVMDGVILHEKAGSVTIKITVAPAGGGNQVMLAVTPDAKVPRATEARVYWQGKDGELEARDPRQPRLFDKSNPAEILPDNRPADAGQEG